MFQDISIDEYCDSLQKMGLEAYVIQHFRGAMAGYQHGVMSGMNDIVERLTGKKPMSAAEFARAHSEQLNGKAKS